MSSTGCLSRSSRPPSPAVGRGPRTSGACWTGCSISSAPVANGGTCRPSDLPALAHGVRLLSNVPGRGRVGEHPLPSRRHAARGRGARGQSHGGHRRHPERCDDGKGGPRGWDGAKRMQGRKRHVAVDTQGLLLGVVVHAADIQDADGLWGLLKRLKPLDCWLGAVFADSIYNRLAALLACFLFGLTLIIVRRVAGRTGFVVQPRRWVVERT